MTDAIGGVDVSRETLEALHAFSALVLKWTPKINLISASTRADIWDRHIIDSVQIYGHAPEKFNLWLDIGSGGGFPGIVAAIIGKQYTPAAAFILIESDQRKSAFLRNVVRELALNASVSAVRIENVPSVGADVVSARALGALPVLLPLVAAHIADHGVALLHKGRQATKEIEDARKDWRFDLEEAPSLTDPEARILMIQRISRAA
ncbi:16S rRNA (guanine(527)-N(7))-methyltransferase RsmG [Yoonia sp.]|uniref:16S rRNA (guanine(527)-N(7))-methyltransferase RsmG n=1 Tax=Yoonia sp. TaxID=2212373 RepID=UPI00391D6BCF